MSVKSVVKRQARRLIGIKGVWQYDTNDQEERRPISSISSYRYSLSKVSLTRSNLHDYDCATDGGRPKFDPSLPGS
jgi:hypothetical protein